MPPALYYILYSTVRLVIWLSKCTNFWKIQFCSSVWFSVNHYWRRVQIIPFLKWFESLQGRYERSSELCSALDSMCWLFLQQWGRRKSPDHPSEKPKGTFLLISAGLYSSWQQTWILGLTQSAKAWFPDLVPMLYYRGENCLCVCIVKVAMCSLVRILPTAPAGLVKP